VEAFNQAVDAERVREHAAKGCGLGLKPGLAGMRMFSLCT